ncbi:MAG: Nucleotidyltransferase domain protein [Syntrophaceae bacterium PtaB.Bin095]|nr:MAG: Nucleotidyltransferase domain protein [Syntrophaceae bacterium PtaB.Bin095]
MAGISNETIETVRRFVRLVKNANIKVEKVVIFGSYAKGTAGKWSDVDLAIVSEDFSGIDFNDHKKLVPFLLKSDSKIEPHPFRPEDFTEDNAFAREIMKSGIELHLSELS